MEIIDSRSKQKSVRKRQKKGKTPRLLNSRITRRLLGEKYYLDKSYW